MLRGLAIALVVAGLFLFAVSALELADRERYQSIEQQQLQTALERESARAPHVARGAGAFTAAGARARAARRGAWGRLEIDRVGLSVVLDEGIDSKTLRRAVGHVPGTAFPGEVGNVVLAGHRDSLFRDLRHVRTGDTLRIRTTDGSFAYAVRSVRIVEPERVDVVAPLPDRREVTLVTCYPFYYVGPAPQRYVVRAELVDETAVSATAAPASVDPRQSSSAGR